MPGILTILDGEIRAAAEAFFGIDLADVHLHFGSLPAALGAVAFTHGNHIYLDSDVIPPYSSSDLEILGHELTHVVQQRQGRVRANASFHGLPANNDVCLELEAEELGRRFVGGGSSNLKHLRVSQQYSPVVQGLLKIGGRMCKGAPELSPKSSIILKLIQGGDDWMSWAATSTSSFYQFADEAELLQGIQTGLHNANLLLLPTSATLLNLVKLFELSEEELKALLAVETAAEANSVAGMNTKKALTSHSLWSQSELVIGDEFLRQVGVDQRPVFQAMTLADRIALFELVNGAATEIGLNQMIQREAASFSVNSARSPLEFADYYQFYISTIQDSDPQAADAGKRARLAESSAESLQPLLYDLLRCPWIRGNPSPNEVSSILQSWIASGSRLGFARLSSALYQLNQNAALRGATGEAAQKIISDYIDQLQKAIVLQQPSSVNLSQDGRERYYQYSLRSVVAELCLSAEGYLTLSNLRTAT